MSYENTSETPAAPVDVMQTYKAMSSPDSKEKRLRSSVVPLLSIKAAIDNKPSEFCAPIDFTFHDLSCLTECLTQDPTNEKNIGDTTARSEEEEESTERPKIKSNALRFSNNNLGDEIWEELEPICSKLVCNLSDVEWMDLSFNSLTTIDNRLPELFPNCKVLYLHGNKLAQMNDVKKLSNMRQLRTVTLHGNPLAENTDGYRPIAISNLPSTVKTLDYTGISAQDLQLAKYNPNKKKKKKKKVAD